MSHSRRASQRLEDGRLRGLDIEGINAKSDRLYELVKELRGRGVPIDGVGFQTHVA